MVFDEAASCRTENSVGNFKRTGSLGIFTHTFFSTSPIDEIRQKPTLKKVQMILKLALPISCGGQAKDSKRIRDGYAD